MSEEQRKEDKAAEESKEPLQDDSKKVDRKKIEDLAKQIFNKG